MTEELKQKAEEYADTKVKDRKGYNARWELVRNAYIAGATENGIQWHDLRKDPNDLPKNEGSYLVCIEYSYRNTYILNYGQDEYDDEEKMEWYDDESTHYSKEVIAWCKIPQFKE